MLTILKEQAHGFVPVDQLEDGVWVRVVDPTPVEQARLIKEFGVDPDLLTDILDTDEQSRIEKEEGGLTAIFRVPVFDLERELSYFTIPYGVIIRSSVLITVSQVDNPVSQDILHHRIRGLNIGNANSLILNGILRASMYYLRFLKDINRKTSSLERELHSSVKNSDLLNLLRFQKSLVYFTTSLRSNELLLDKIQKLSAWHLNEDEQETLEDVRIELRQALEVARIHSNILTGTVDTFASVISNNLNSVMKRLTIVSLSLMIPTLVASIYGMNVPLPFMHEGWIFFAILGLAGVSSLVAMIVFKVRNMY